MADPLSVAAGVIAVATLAYSSAKTLHRSISSIRDAPEIFTHLNDDVRQLCEVIRSLRQQVKKSRANVSLTSVQKFHLQEIDPILKSCKSSCDKFCSTIDHLTRRSRDGQFRLRDRFRLQFNEKDIRALQIRLNSHKSTLTLALQICTYKTVETRMEDLTSRITGQLEGLHVGARARLNSNAREHEIFSPSMQRLITEAQNSRLSSSVKHKSVAPKLYAKTHTAASNNQELAPTGHRYGHMTAMNESRLLMGDLGSDPEGLKHNYDVGIVRDKAWSVAGNMDGAYAADFFR